MARKWKPPYPAVPPPVRRKCPDGHPFRDHASAVNAILVYDPGRWPSVCRRGCGAWHVYDKRKGDG